MFKDLPATGPLFPKLRPIREAHRATEFARACRRSKITDITLHSCRYAWAERAKSTGMPERFVMEDLGQNSKVVHRAYSKNAQVFISALEDYEKKLVEANAAAVIPSMSNAAAA